MRDTILKRWLISNNCLLDKNSDLKPTHFFLDGGKAIIDFNKLEEFHNVYTKCINDNVQLFVVECKTDNFRFFADLDFASERPLEDDIVIGVIGIIHTAICYIYDTQTNVIVCDTEHKQITKNGNNLVKQGFHLFWPDIYVNINTALKIRKYVLEKVKLVYGERENSNSWADVIDEVVYKANGIRMNGSYKINNLQIDNRKYSLWTVLKPDGTIDDKEVLKLKDTIELIKATTIRSPLQTITTVKNSEPLNINEQITIENEDKSKEDDFYLKRVNKNNRKFDEIVKFFDLHMAGKNYKVSDITGILHIEKTDSYILKTNSKYCQNITKEHNSCGVYFILSKNGLSQKCYCRCNTLEGRNSGYCKNYTSPPVPCSIHILRALNWEPKKKNAKKTVEDYPLQFSLSNKNISYQAKVAMLRTNIYQGILAS